MNANTAYEELVRHAREQSLLDSCADLLEWDEETYMPSGGVEHRSEQRALLAGLSHQRATDPRVGELLGELEGSDLVRDPESPAAVNVRGLRRLYDRQTRIPRTLAEELARTTALAHQAWVAARQNADFAPFRPWLERIVALKRSEAESVGYEDEAYDALLDEHEPGATSRELVRLYDALRRELVPFAEAIAAAPRRPRLAVLERDFPIERQRALVEAVAATLGFDFTRGRLDTSAHPFCTGIGPGDCRFTTRFDARNLCGGLLAVVHEVGHALYEQGLEPEQFGTPLGEPASLGVHESQSRLWENRVGRSRAFWEHLFPRAREIFHEALHDVTLDDFHFAVNHVAPSLNRVDADEVTYNLHVLVRFELERALLAGDLQAADVPAAWNEAYRHHLGVTPPSDAEGCLQDSHWAGGLIGYFPTYTLGDVFGAQLFAKAGDELGDLHAAFRAGEFGGLREWLRRNVHRHGRRYTSAALVERVTGTPPDHRPLVDALRGKYAELYGIA
jgi:carboxypeptidase Taq